MSLSGALLIRETTRFGSGLRDDSFVYLSSAEGIANFKGYARQTGEGSLRPTTGFPPGYSFSLAVFNWLGLDLHAGARLLGGLGLSTLVLLTGVGISTATGSPGLAVVAAAMVLVSPTLVEVHSWALSESVYLPLSLAGILLAFAFLTSASPTPLVLSALVVGMASLTRYVGVSLTLALGACLALGLGRPRRWRAVAGFAGLSLAPLAAFLARNVMVSGGLANRPILSWRPLEPSVVDRASRILVSWLLPAPGINPSPGLSRAIACLLLAGLLIGTVWGILEPRSGWQRERTPPAVRLVTTLGVHSIVYLAVLFTSMAVADPRIQAGFSAVGERLLAPAHLDLMLIIPLGLHIGWKGAKSPWRTLAVGVALLFTLAQVFGGVQKVRELRADGLGFNSFAWRSSPAISYLRELPEIPIYTNEVGAIYLLTGRYASFIPAKVGPSAPFDRSEYSEDLSRMRRTIRSERGILAILGSVPRVRLEAEHLAELTIGLTLVEEFADGLIYRYTGGD